MKDIINFINEGSNINISSDSEAVNMINAAFEYLCKDKSNENNIGMESDCDMKFKNSREFGHTFTLARLVPASKSSYGNEWTDKYGIEYVLQCANANLAKRRKNQ